MQSLLLTLRLIHIVSGVYWAGTMFFFATFLDPSLRSLGPDGGRVMVRLFERGFLNLIPAVAVTSILSGTWLLWTQSGGFDPVYMGSRQGAALSVGALTSIIAFLIGLIVVRPTAGRIWNIARQMPQATDEAARNVLMADMSRLRAKTSVAARIVVTLLFITVSMMAVARALG